MSGRTLDIDWASWLARWDAQQAGYSSRREERFALMLDLVEAVRGEAPLVLDLACGPGSVSQRLLARLPAASAVAVDVDPVLLALGQGALGDAGGRLHWVEADLRDPSWAVSLPGGPYDAILSTTALHWLTPPVLRRVYADAAALLAPGGLMLNGDQFNDLSTQPGIRQAVALTRVLRGGRRTAETWEQWWDALAAEPGMADLLERRARLQHGAHHGPDAPTLELHRAALNDAGFAETGVVWSDLDDRVLLAVR